MTDAAKVYLSLYSVDCLSSATRYEDVDNIVACLKETLTLYDRSKNVHIECPNDLFEFGDIGSSLGDRLLDILDDNWDYYLFYLAEINKIVLGYVKHNNTECLIFLIKNQLIDLPRHYAFVISNKYQWPDIVMDQHTTSWKDTLNKNSKFISDSNGNVDNFIAWSEMNYEYIDFHPDLKNTLSTIQVGTYIDYQSQLSHCLNTLNQSYHLISNDPNKNQEDLNVISAYSHTLGNSLSCTRQAKNKVSAIFSPPPLVASSEFEEINCEYHLKIDTDDNGNRIPHGKGNPVRVYFGLKTYKEYERKQIKLAHMGKHL
ncbi:hypothetical protein [Marinomonas mediterranea]|jgi:hypothetical protein|uniref:Uncharacterized protein n=1 Tax=Marinomonas mediterranea (strain ATCC 700492 / JCM 21426 / NBRC 103028 / MMB-1) TaxID=717774 RepID=F2K3V5_MARM1|nr:hypothetical protein [Marinomonas mediterranea]ADZ90204.1 hypothetical protein Marme_0929 [Marinomonas mediterranea MMB-1]WCN16403.1 hypothetical protein GV053_04700 [Marinomonas mediterranea MMB-1]